MRSITNLNQENKEIHILLFYKYVEIKNPHSFSKKHLKFCKEHGLLGRILIGKEGINGSISGVKEQTELYKRELTSDKRFSDMTFKEDIGKMYPFTKMNIRIRKEIVAFGRKVNLENKGEYISPEKLYNMYKNNEDFVMLDARNHYEHKVGKFKNSIHLNIKTFREFPKKINQLEDKKDKKIVMYCTGGVRCEKASAYLKEKGFKEVYHIKDGIINFGKEYPNSYWEGKLFVFDKRLVTPVNKGDEPIAKCKLCGCLCDLYMNCRNLKCDELFIACHECQHKYQHCCSKECQKEFLIQADNKARIKQGRPIKVIN